MRLTGLLLASSAATFAACAGEKSAPSDATRAATASTTAAAAPAEVAPAQAKTAPASAAAATVAPLPITGKTYEVKMIGDEKGYRFEPANLTIKVGDGIKFVNVLQGMHNVAFGDMPAASRAQLNANMPEQTSAGASPKMADLSGPLLVTANDTYTVSFAGVKPGVYAFNCTPHLALGMTGQVTVQ